MQCVYAAGQPQLVHESTLHSLNCLQHGLDCCKAYTALQGKKRPLDTAPTITNSGTQLVGV